MRREKMTEEKNKGKLTTSFTTGAIAIVFLLIGYQTAVFIHNAAVTKILADRDKPDTVFVYSENIQAPKQDAHYSQNINKFEKSNQSYYKKESSHSEGVMKIREKNTPRSYQSFPFDPNSVSIEDLQKLGFSLKQAQSIDNYRQKGGRFRRKSDFAKSYVVEDSVYQRLEPYITIPKIDLNKADSTEFDSLPGIGKYFASKMVSYREQLCGYSYKEQLMDIYHFDQEKFDGLSDLICIDTTAYPPYPIWELPEEELKKHPYIGKYSAHGIIIFRENNPKSKWTISDLNKAGVIKDDMAKKLSLCRLQSP